MTDPGRVRYAKLDGANIAYRVFGDGPLDVLVALPMMFTLESFGHLRSAVVFFERLASFARVVVFDRRGFGLSDAVSLHDLGQATAWADDVGAVMDAASIERASLVGLLGGGQMAIAFAAASPDRANHLVLMHTLAKQTQSDDYPWGWSREYQDRQIRLAESGWDDLKDEDLTTLPGGPEIPTDEYRLIMQRVGGPSKMAALHRMMGEVDVRDELARIACPTLILHRRDNPFTAAESARHLAQKISGSTLVELPGPEHSPFRGNVGAIADEIEFFITGRRPARAERILCAVLFTDIVGSTDSKAKSGDAQWKELLSEHHRLVREAIDEHGGREVNTAGDGFLTTFDTPMTALRCASAIVDRVARIGLHIRAGVHAGEVERFGDDITGLTVDIGARVREAARPDEVLVSSTVRDMAIGSSIVFEERGEQELKGVPGRWRLYAVTD